MSINFQYGTIMWRLERSSRELSSRGGGQFVVRARGRALRITSLVLLAAVICRIPYTTLIYWRHNTDEQINSVSILYFFDFAISDVSLRFFSLFVILLFCHLLQK